jgi:hypothetical protein
MNNRTVVKRDLSHIAEIGIVAVLGKVPRHNRREAGRIFANEAYRFLNDLPIKNFRASRPVVEWIAKEYRGYIAAREAELSEASNQTDRGDANDNGSSTESVAPEPVNRQGNEETLGNN